MIEDKTSEIILCSGIHIDKNYDNVLDVSKSTLVGYLRTHSEYVGDNYTIVPRYKNKLNVSCPYATALKCNYMAFRNPDYDGEYCFAFIDTVDYVSDETCNINYTLDVWHTNHDKFNINKVFVEREHVNDDTFGKHTIPEDIGTGEYTISSETDASDLQDVCPVMAATLAPDMENNFNFYGGNNYESLGYYIFKGASMTTYDGGDQLSALESYIDKYAQNSKTSSIVTIFMAPRKLVGWTADGTWNGALSYVWRSASDVFEHTNPIYTDYDKPVVFTDLTITRPTTFGTYTPKNNKCYCYPYQFLNLTNNNGGNAAFNYENFSSNSISFEINGIVTPSCSIRAIPKNYKNQTKCYNEGLQAAKYPVCSWQNDIYTNWLTQQGVNLAISAVTSIGKIAGGAATGNAGAVISGMTQIASTMADLYQHSLIPPQAEGNINSGNVASANSKLTFTAQTIQVREEYIRNIDAFLSRYGYKVNEVKQPSLHNRTKFDFIKVGGTDNLISGKIPATDLNEINNICRRGTTIFHDITSFGDYTVNNPIVTP